MVTQSTLAWVATLGFLVAFVLPVLYLTYLSMQRDAHVATPGSEPADPES